jgi:hypothetical protein
MSPMTGANAGLYVVKHRVSTSIMMACPVFTCNFASRPIGVRIHRAPDAWTRAEDGLQSGGAALRPLHFRRNALQVPGWIPCLQLFEAKFVGASETRVLY